MRVSAHTTKQPYTCAIYMYGAIPWTLTRRAQAEDLYPLQILNQSTQMLGDIWQQSEHRWHS